VVLLAGLLVCSTPQVVRGTFDIYAQWGVATTSDTGAWAVGDGWIDHWDGTEWTRDWADEYSNLRGIAATSETNAWAVGWGGTILRWDGTTWSVQDVPSEVTDCYYLLGVAATSATNAWAVGYCPRQQDRTLIVHWDGTAWSVQDSPNKGTFPSHLSAVAASSEDDAWAVGDFRDEGADVSQTLMLHWDGTSWKRYRSRNVRDDDNFLNGITVVSASRAWAVGHYVHDGHRSLILRWNGSAWRRQPSPGLGSLGNLDAVTATSNRNAWAVGNRGPQTLILRWDGTAWERQSSPNEPGWEYNKLFGVAASSADDAWAVGCYNDGWMGEPLVLHWDGSTWNT
jgi:hypothetical protein